MHTAVRPWVTTGVALVGASVIAVTPVAPPPPALVPQVHVPEVHLPAVRLSASVADIFTFPAFRQFVLNQINDVVTLGVGFARAGAALGESIAMLPAVLRTVTRQVLSGDLLGALTTIETALVGSVVAVGEPILAAIIERRQRVLAVQQALQLAVPEAFFSVVGGFGRALDEVVRAFIVAGQGVVDALLPLDLGNLVNALVDGTGLVLGSFVTGGQQVVDGIVDAQQTIATALAAQPAAAPATAFSAGTDVTDVPDLSRKTAMVTLSPQADTATAEPASDTTEAASTKKTPKADADADQSAAKDSTSAATNKPDQATTESPKKDTEKDTKKSDKESQSDGAKEK